MGEATVLSAEIEVRHLRGGMLYRALKVATPEDTFELVYDGRGLGYESVYVDKELAWRGQSGAWFYPRFFFFLGAHPASLDVRIWPWLGIRSFTLRIRGEVVYTEGSPAGTDWQP